MAAAMPRRPSSSCRARPAAASACGPAVGGILAAAAPCLTALAAAPLRHLALLVLLGHVLASSSASSSAADPAVQDSQLAQETQRRSLPHRPAALHRRFLTDVLRLNATGREKPQAWLHRATNWPRLNASKDFAALRRQRRRVPTGARASPHKGRDEDTPQPEESPENQFIDFEKRKWLGVFLSMTFFDWAVFFSFALVFLVVYHNYVMGLPSVTRYHGLAIFGWISMAVLYNFLVYLRCGHDASLVWFNGYLLELIFSLENVFVFHIIIEGFGTPTVCAQKALFLIVCCQVVFEVVLYMGLADVIDSLRILPYILGAWLVYLGIHSAIETESKFDILETRTVKMLRRVLGDRLVLEYDSNSCIFTCSGSASNGNEKCCMTMLGLVFIILLMADFFLEIDVTLTKIEESEDEYLSFTSSALAGFAVPELFFVARDIFRCFPLLKFGISFVLVFYGAQMLLPGIIQLSPLDGCGLIVVVMVLCILMSIIVRKGKLAKGGSRFHEEEPLTKNSSSNSLTSGDSEYGTTKPNLRKNNFSFVFKSQWTDSDDCSEQAYEVTASEQLPPPREKLSPRVPRSSTF